MRSKFVAFKLNVMVQPILCFHPTYNNIRIFVRQMTFIPICSFIHSCMRWHGICIDLMNRIRFIPFHFVKMTRPGYGFGCGIVIQYILQSIRLIIPSSKLNLFQSGTKVLVCLIHHLNHV